MSVHPLRFCSPSLAQEIADHLGVKLGKSTIKSDVNIFALMILTYNRYSFHHCEQCSETLLPINS